MPKTNRFRRGLAPLAVLALAVLLLGTAWLHLGWRAIAGTLEDEAGDPAALAQKLEHSAARKRRMNLE